MNKKTLFSILFVIFIIPAMAQAVTAGEMAESVKGAIGSIGVTIIAIGWVVAGILYLTSGGSPEKTGTAKKAVFAAVIGTVLIAVSYMAYDLIKNLLNIT
jgi:hypothetical protein